MTKFHLLSDLHLEMGDYTPPPIDCDFVLLAGDIALRDDAFPWIRRHFPNSPTIYVNGNHEYYKNYFAATIHSHRTKTNTFYPLVCFLENELQQYPDKSLTIYGGTMWTDFMLYGTPTTSKKAAMGGMNDFHLIRRMNDAMESVKLHPDDTAKQHKRFLLGLENAAKNRLDKFVVVTHHAPHPRSLDINYEGDNLNPAYASNLEDLIREYEPDLWVHGHVHCSQDYYIGKTRIVCNPRGYPRGSSNNPKFDPNLVIEI